LVTVTHDHDLLRRFDRSIDVMDLLEISEKPQITQIDADNVNFWIAMLSDRSFASLRLCVNGWAGGTAPICVICGFPG
jgi:hypothetical protein